MNLILNIDTAVSISSVCLSENSGILGERKSNHPMDSAAWIHPAIESLMKEQKADFSDLSAIAVSAGPGSYTGLRVGMATAKGLCYILNKPLICLNTLEVMAGTVETPEGLICPMIDARRMEVFTALYDPALNPVLPPTNLILDQNSFKDQLDHNAIFFLGNGSQKLQRILNHPSAQFIQKEVTARHMAKLSHKMLEEGKIASLAYAVPVYGKDFYSAVKNNL